MDGIFSWAYGVTGMSPELQGKISLSTIIVLALWGLRTLMLKLILKQTEDVKIHYTWRKITTYIGCGIGFILIFRIWFEHVELLATYLGLLSAGLSIALKDVVSSVAAWLFIIWRRPLDVGDRIQIGEHSGDVIDIGVFQFTILEIGNWVEADHSTGRIIQIPNGVVFVKPLANFTKGFQYIWNEVPVLVTFESNWKKGKQILQHIAQEHGEHLSKAAEKEIKKAGRQFMIFYSVLTPIVYTGVRDSGVMLTIRYICKPRRRRDSEQAIWENILEEFGKCTDIDFAYPTERRYYNASEGKSGCKPDYSVAGNVDSN